MPNTHFFFPFLFFSFLFFSFLSFPFLSFPFLSFSRLVEFWKPSRMSFHNFKILNMVPREEVAKQEASRGRFLFTAAILNSASDHGRMKRHRNLDMSIFYFRP